MFKRKERILYPNTANRIKLDAYSTRFDTTQTEINALRTKVAITLGLFGVLFSIFFNYPGIRENTFENNIFLILLCSVIIVGFNYLLIYIQIHNLKHIIYPTDSVLREIEDEKSNSKIEKCLFDDLKSVCDKLSQDQLFYSQIIQALDLFFVFSLILSFAGYIIVNDTIIDINTLDASYIILLLLFVIIEAVVMASLICSMQLGLKDKCKKIIVQTEGIIRFVLITGNFILLIYSPYLFPILSTFIPSGSVLQILSLIMYVILAVADFIYISKKVSEFIKDVKKAVKENRN